jgi:hypothetical protein
MYIIYGITSFYTIMASSIPREDRIARSELLYKELETSIKNKAIENVLLIPPLSKENPNLDGFGFPFVDLKFTDSQYGVRITIRNQDDDKVNVLLSLMEMKYGNHMTFVSNNNKLGKIDVNWYCFNCNTFENVFDKDFNYPVILSKIHQLHWCLSDFIPKYKKCNRVTTALGVVSLLGIGFYYSFFR